MLWTYYLGVAHYIFRNYDHTRIKILVSSAGTFGGVPLALGLDPYAWCTSDWAKCLAHFASRPCGMFFDQAEFYKQLWDEYLPVDAHTRVSGRLFISITLFPSFQNRVVSHFATRDELINCIVASSCFPLVFVRNMPTTSFGMAFDGGLSNDQPCVSERTITVSCINLKTDLSPKCAHDAKTAASSTITSNSSSNNAAHHYSSAARFSVVDMVSVPRFERVWEIAHAAESDAACCERLASLSEWRAIAKAQ